jgi:hypothetical protein
VNVGRVDRANTHLAELAAAWHKRLARIKRLAVTAAAQQRHRGG